VCPTCTANERYGYDDQLRDYEQIYSFTVAVMMTLYLRNITIVYLQFSYIVI